MTIKGSLQQNIIFSEQLFNGRLGMEDRSIHLLYSVRKKLFTFDVILTIFRPISSSIEIWSNYRRYNSMNCWLLESNEHACCYHLPIIAVVPECLRYVFTMALHVLSLPWCCFSQWILVLSILVMLHFFLVLHSGKSRWKLCVRIVSGLVFKRAEYFNPCCGGHSNIHQKETKSQVRRIC